MSKLANLIEAHQTERVKSFPVKSVSTVMDELSNSAHISFLAKREYRLGVTFQVKGFAQSDNGKDMEDIKDMCKRQILHEVFGEFQPLIRRLERALYDHDFDEARTALRELDNEMRW